MDNLTAYLAKAYTTFTKKIWSQTSQVLETCEVLDPK